MQKKIHTCGERITQIKEKWYLLEPLYFQIITTHHTVLNQDIKTIRSGNGKIEYNTDFIDSLTDKDLEIVMRCELLRILLKHPYTRRKEIPKISYAASNITLKEYMPEVPFLHNSEEVFGTDSFKRKHFEFYYKKLLEQASQQSGEGDSQDDSSSTSSGDESKNKKNTGNDSGKNTENQHNESGENSEDDSGENSENQENNTEKNTKENSEQQESENSKSPTEQYADNEEVGRENTRNWGEDDLMQNKINDHIQTAQQNRMWGSITGDLKDQIIASCIPKADYRSILKAFRATILSQKRRLTRMKPSRRYGFQHLGSRRDFCTKLLFAVDVSGSMSRRDLSVGFSVVNRLFKYGIEQVDVIQFDTEIKGELMTMKKAKRNINIKGRGGTDFQAVVDYIEKNPIYDGVIVFTDGYSFKPLRSKKVKTRILWLFNSEENYKYSLQKLSEIGKCAFIS